MIVNTLPDFYIHITADSGMQLVNKLETPEIRVKEIYVPLNGNYSMWVEELEINEENNN